MPIGGIFVHAKRSKLLLGYQVNISLGSGQSQRNFWRAARAGLEVPLRTDLLQTSLISSRDEDCQTHEILKTRDIWSSP